MKNIIIGTAGHVDHGKTRLIKALSGIDTDRLEEENKKLMVLMLEQQEELRKRKKQLEDQEDMLNYLTLEVERLHEEGGPEMP